MIDKVAAFVTRTTPLLFSSHRRETRDTWTQLSDNHAFRLFWARIDALPEIVSPQNRWAGYVTRELGYAF